MTKTIASASRLPDGRIAILVEEGEAPSLHSFLQSKGVACTPPQRVGFKPLRVIRDSKGKTNIEDDGLECEIIAYGSTDDFGQWLQAWITGK